MRGNVRRSEQLVGNEGCYSASITVFSYSVPPQVTLHQTQRFLCVTSARVHSPERRLFVPLLTCFSRNEAKPTECQRVTEGRRVLVSQHQHQGAQIWTSADLAFVSAFDSLTKQ